MKLSDIVAYRNQLESMSIESIRSQAERELAAVNHVVSSNEIELNFYKTRIKKQMEAVESSFTQFSKVFDNLKTDLTGLIQKNETAYYKESTRMYQEEMSWETNEYILNRKLHIDDESNIIIRSRLRSNTDWRIPGMIIRPGLETFIEELVPLDPLYIVDENVDLIAPSMAPFNDVYRARLRPYVINEKDQEILAKLPNGQFGVIFAYNFFNYKPIELIKQYLAEMYFKLRPGGIVMMTINDCDQSHGVSLAENKMMCYTPKSKIIAIAESAGFDLTFERTGLGDISWIELRRPGDITSRRGGQTLAKIVHK
jgi:SAM-dependent methyltransferase